MSEAPSVCGMNSSCASISSLSTAVINDVSNATQSPLIPMSNTNPIVVEEVQVPANVPKVFKLRSKVWNEFARDKFPDGDVRATCSHCKKSFRANSDKGTSHLQNHLNTCWQRIQNKPGQKLLITKRGTNQTNSLSTWKFDPQVTRQIFAQMISAHDYPFNMPQHCYFQRFVKSIDPKVRLYTRNTVRGDVGKLFKEMKVGKIEFFDQLKSKVSLTTDIWTSDHQNKSYSCVTCHYIDDDWELRKKIIAFPLFPPPHSALCLADSIQSIALEWNIDRKLFVILVDNASNNDVMIRQLKEWLIPKGVLPNNGAFFHVRSSCHSLNLIVQDGLKPIKELLKKIRASVLFVKATHARIDAFDKILSQLKFTRKGLSSDVKTRWNSTYLMLEHAVELELAFVRLKEFDKEYLDLPDHESWVTGRLICGCLKIFYQITLKFSMVKHPTANLYFMHVFDIRKCINKWITSEHLCIKVMAMKMKEKFDKYWSTCSLFMIIGMILDPRYKMFFIEYAFSELYGSFKEVRLQDVLDSLKDLYFHYKSQAGNSTEISSGYFPGGSSSSFLVPSSVGICSSETVNDFDSFMKKKYIDEPPVQKTELDLYLEEDLFPKNEAASFDILLWWKANSPKFPILGRIARDILAVPVSTVASESAFSCSGRVITEHRACLKPDMVEALNCMKDWLPLDTSLEVIDESPPPPPSTNTAMIDLVL